MIPLLFLGLIVSFLTSCCGTLGGCRTQSKIVRVGCENRCYNPSPGCCDVVSKAVLKRATAQGGTGEPHIGTIPTMKVLAP
ncbi:MAG: hypothetical protein ACON38_03990 [Akkermansiaceae bacterium]